MATDGTSKGKTGGGNHESNLRAAETRKRNAARCLELEEVTEVMEAKIAILTQTTERAQEEKEQEIAQIKREHQEELQQSNDRYNAILKGLTNSGFIGRVTDQASHSGTRQPDTILDTDETASAETESEYAYYAKWDSHLNLSEDPDNNVIQLTKLEAHLRKEKKDFEKKVAASDFALATVKKQYNHQLDQHMELLKTKAGMEKYLGPYLAKLDSRRVEYYQLESSLPLPCATQQPPMIPRSSEQGYMTTEFGYPRNTNSASFASQPSGDIGNTTAQSNLEALRTPKSGLLTTSENTRDSSTGSNSRVATSPGSKPQKRKLSRIESLSLERLNEVSHRSSPGTAETIATTHPMHRQPGPIHSDQHRTNLQEVAPRYTFRRPKAPPRLSTDTENHRWDESDDSVIVVLRSKRKEDSVSTYFKDLKSRLRNTTDDKVKALITHNQRDVRMAAEKELERRRAMEIQEPGPEFKVEDFAK